MIVPYYFNFYRSDASGTVYTYPYPWRTLLCCCGPGQGGGATALWPPGSRLVIRVFPFFELKLRTGSTTVTVAL